eukprot:CAMPEP_0172696938 /NCGR_PEP_ID=MMETSP1074-20121228/28400_1 /TAXON_ID=2916 /ORGANISM="Ceratium fusus, Strain PA161109" /LENGTH=51 /DNA_ID=CAMNT_0013517755 /DNA_START=176 /DNA_END=328 /DNA_ORIENTATION=-
MGIGENAIWALWKGVSVPKCPLKRDMSTRISFTSCNRKELKLRNFMPCAST